jgi:hypothetical protein
MSGPDFNSDRELGRGQRKWVVENAIPGVDVREIETSKGKLKTDRYGRCVVNDPTLANEIRQEHSRDLSVNRIFSNHPSDRGHKYFHTCPALPWHKYDELGRRIREEPEKEQDDERGSKAMASVHAGGEPHPKLEP